LQRAVATGALLGVAFLCVAMLTKSSLLGSDSAHHYAHVWYISDQIFHHARFPLHIRFLESGKALAFPYAVVPYLVTALPYTVLGDRAVTIAIVAGFAFYGYAATRARPTLRDPRLLALIYVNTFLIEGLLSFQFAFLWACGFFFMGVEAVDKRRWATAAVWAVLAVTTHLFVGVVAVAGYTLFAVIRRPRDSLPLLSAMAVAALVVLPYALYVRTTPAVESTPTQHIWGTLRYMARFRGAEVALPFVVSMLAGVLRPLFLPAFLAMAVGFGMRLDGKHVNLYGLRHESSPFYGEFVRSPEFDRSLTYRVLEPNDREDGAYQLIRSGAVLGQEFFDQSQFRLWWDTPEMYACFLGAKKIDVVLLEKDYIPKFNRNEHTRLAEFEQQGKARVIYRDPAGRFTAYDVRDARTEGVTLDDCRIFAHRK
jgi:ribulose bisphosphate carboxylase small subunit